MTEVTLSLKGMEAMKAALKPGDKVKYNTPVAEFQEDNKKNTRTLHNAKIVKKLRNLAIIEYNAKRGSKTVKALATMTYKEIYFQRRGCAW